MELLRKFNSISIKSLMSFFRSFIKKQGANKKLIVILFLLFSTAWSIDLLSQTEKYKAAYIYNFTNYIEWPSAYRTGNFIIGVLGTDDPIIPELKIIASSKKVYGQTIEVKSFSSASDMALCHVLFVGSNQKNNIEAAISSLGSSSTLIISDFSDGITKGSAMNFVLDAGKLKFEIKKSTAKSRGINISPDLERLALKSY